ncbi:MAG: 2Fe-2S iron-sulfur cluster-binding protein [Sandaracinaceae bacterium]
MRTRRGPTHRGPIARLLPERLRRPFATLRRDLYWLGRDLRGEGRPFLVRRAPRDRRREVLGSRPLEVRSVVRETPEAITLHLAEPDGRPLTFRAGQFLTLCLEVDGQPLKRAYSFCTSPLDGPTAAITVKRVPGGRASTWLHRHAEAGLRLAVLGPSGTFGAPTQGAPHLVLLGGGSGITPLIAIAETALRSRPDGRVTLIYGNRGVDDIIFRRRLADLAASHAERLRVVHVREDPPPGWTGEVGRLDRAGVARLLADVDRADAERPGPDDRAYLLCGPLGMMDAAKEVLLERGVPRGAIREERFQSPADPLGASAARPERPLRVRFRRGEEERVVSVAPGQTLLEAALAAGVGLPFSCTLGGCGACRVRRLGGAVHVDEPSCLSAEERAAGYVLTCVGRPLDDRVALEVPA